MRKMASMFTASLEVRTRMARLLARRRRRLRDLQYLNAKKRVYWIETPQEGTFFDFI